MARPTLRGEPAVKVLNVRVTRTEHQRLRLIAESNSVTVGQLLAEALAEYLGEREERGTFASFDVSSPAC